MKDMEVWEAMELIGLKKGKQVNKKLPSQFSKALSKGEVDSARTKYWCHKVSIKTLAAEYGVSINAMTDCIKRRDAYKDM